MAQPAILLNPHPRRAADIFDKTTFNQLERLAALVVYDDGPMPDDVIDSHLPNTVVLLGQCDMPRERLDRAPLLRGIINVETNFLPNIDYEACFTRGIHVLTPGSAFAPAVAEMGLGFAIDLSRGITAADRAFRVGQEGWGLDGNDGCFTLTGCSVGLIGFGDLGRALLKLLSPFSCNVKAYDPWLPDYYIAAQGASPASLEEVLATSQVIFVFAGASSENPHFIGRAEFETIRPGSAFVLLSRAGVVDFPEMLRQAQVGRLRVACDVFPEEPVATDDPIRKTEGILLSAHRAGAMRQALYDIGRQAVADTEMMLRGLPPIVCRQARRETVGRMRSKPIAKT